MSITKVRRVPGMPSANVEAFLERFPWVQDHIDSVDIKTTELKRFDPSIMHQPCARKDMEEGALCHFVRESILVLNERGQFLMKVGTIEIPASPNYRWWKPWTYPRTEHRPKETLHEAILRLRQAGSDHTIGFIMTEFNCHVVVHEVPREVTLDLSHLSRPFPHFRRVLGAVAG